MEKIICLNIVMKEEHKTIINPLTGRKITVGGRTYRHILQIGGLSQSAPNVRLFDTDVIKQKSDIFFDSLVKKPAGKPIPTKLAVRNDSENPVIPKTRQNLIGSNLPPAPSGSHSYYHHHAPFSQDFGDYVCIKKETLRDLGMFLRDSMFRSVDNI
jgi:hypothetical protein